MKKQIELSDCSIIVSQVASSTIVEIVLDIKVLNQIYTKNGK